MTKRASTARKGDAIDVVEAAYNLDPALNETQWVTGVVQALYPRFDYGLGICAFISDAERPFEAVAGFDLPEGWDRAMNALMSSSAGPKLMNVRHPAQTASHAIGKQDFASNEAMQREWRPRGVMDGAGISVNDGTGHVMTIAAPMPFQAILAAPLAAYYNRIGAHIAAGWRLRQSLATQAAPAAVLSPSGKVVHAEGEARERSSLENLRDAAVAIDRARGALRRQDDDDALQLWRVLVDGEWSLVDRFESDGRRYLVAHRNPPVVRDPRALTPRERQVVALTALGHSLKLIAYELGISSSVASIARSQAMRKLGVTTLADLTRLLAAVRSGKP